MLTGENGILTQAQNAKVETRGAAVEEAKDLWKQEKLAASKTGTTAKSLGTLLDELESQKLLIGNERQTIEETGSVTIGNRTIEFGTGAPTLVEMFENAESCDKTDGSCTNEDHLHVGDYVEYTPGNNEPKSVGKEETGYDEEQVYSVDENTTWRVLGLSEDGNNLLITSGSPIKKDGSNPYLIMQGAEGYINCKDTLDKVSSVYHNEELAEETRSITIEDINRVVGVAVEGNNVYKVSDPDKNNIDLIGCLGRSYTYPSGAYAPENYMNEVYNKGLTNKKVGDEEPLTAYGYLFESLGLNDRVKNMLFKGTTSSEKCAKSYWLASPGVYDYSSEVYFALGAVGNGGVSLTQGTLFYGGGIWSTYTLSVRPVVVLKSEITTDKVPKSENQNEQEVDWEYENNLRVNDGYVDKGQVEGSEE